jgi:hypothetical protein
MVQHAFSMVLYGMTGYALMSAIVAGLWGIRALRFRRTRLSGVSFFSKLSNEDGVCMRILPALRLRDVYRLLSMITLLMPLYFAFMMPSQSRADMVTYPLPGPSPTEFTTTLNEQVASSGCQNPASDTSYSTSSSAVRAEDDRFASFQQRFTALIVGTIISILALAATIVGVTVQLRKTIRASRGDKSFDLVESTTALACASGELSIVVQLKREIGKLWDNIDKAPYKQLFNGSVSGIYVWRCVRVQRSIDHALDALVKELGFTGRDYGVAVHGNRIIAALVCDHLNMKQYQNPQQRAFEGLFVGNTVSDATKLYFARLRDAVTEHYGNAIIPTLFENQTKCKHLFDVCVGSGQ